MDSFHNINPFPAFYQKAKRNGGKFRTMANNKELFAKAMIWFGFFMVAVFLGLGIMLLFFPVYPYLPADMKKILGIFFIAYGIFRLARITTQIRQLKRKE